MLIIRNLLFGKITDSKKEPIVLFKFTDKLTPKKSPCNDSIKLQENTKLETQIQKLKI